MGRTFKDYFGLIAGFALLGVSVAFAADGAETGPQAAGRALRLRDAIALAQKNDRNLLIQEEEVNALAAEEQEASGRFWPRVDVIGGYTHNASVLSFPASLMAGKKKDPMIYTGFRNDGRVGVSASQNVYNGGLDLAAARQARVKLEAGRQKLRLLRLESEFRVKSLYYGLLLAGENIRIADERVRQAKAHSDDVERKLKEGTASRFEYLQSRVQVSKFVPETVRARNSAEILTAELKKVLGLRMTDPLEVLGRLELDLFEISEEAFLREALEGRPEVRLKALGLDIGKISIDMAASGWRPQVAASAGFDYRSSDAGDLFNPRHNDWSVGGSVSIPVFDGATTLAKVRQAEARYRQSVLESEDIRDQTAVDVRRACLDLRHARAIIDAQKDGIEEAKEALRISEVSYENGVGTHLELLDCQVSLFRVEKDHSESLFDHWMAKAFLDRVRGAFDSEEGQDEAKT